MLEKEKQSFFEEAKTQVENYLEDRLLLLKLQATEKMAKVASRLYIMLAIGLLLFIVLMIVTVIVGYFLAFLTDNFIVGFGIVALLYIVAIFILYFLHKKFLGKYVMDRVIQLMFDNKDETDAI